MPRDIPVGNGRLLITFDDRYQIRDLYYPHVGQENHAGAGPCHFGVWAELPAARSLDDRAFNVGTGIETSVNELAEGLIQASGRRVAVEHGTLPGLSGMALHFREYRKTTTIYAVQLDYDYVVDTLEGRHQGRAGSWLAIGQHGELYPIDEAIFAETYEPVE